MLVYDNVLKGLERFAGAHIRFEAVTVSWLGRYADFLRKEGKTQTTIAIHLRHLRAILNEAKRLGSIKDAQYPFGRGRYEIQAGEGRKLALTLEQIGQIANYEDGTEATAKYRDYWLFLYLCNGINVADFVKLRYRDIVLRSAKDRADDQDPQGNPGRCHGADAGNNQPLGQPLSFR